MFLILKLEGCVGSCAHLQFKWQLKPDVISAWRLWRRAQMRSPSCGGAVLVRWWLCSRQAQRLRVTGVVSPLGSARRSQSCRCQVGLGSLDSIAGGSQEVCKKLPALPPCFTVLSLRLVCKLLIGCIYLPWKAGWTDIQLPMQSLNFCSLYI